MRPEPGEYAEFYAGYIDRVPETEILPVLEQQLLETLTFWTTIPQSSAELIHSPYTWKIRQVLDHLVDGERIFGYRILRIARGDQTPLPGFDEHHYAAASEECPAPLADIIASFEHLRKANMLVLKNLSPQAWERTGTASGAKISVRALAWILAGHIRHHDQILRRRLA